MRARDFERQAWRRYKRIADEVDAKVLHVLTDGIARLNREMNEYRIWQQRQRKPPKASR